MVKIEPAALSSDLGTFTFPSGTQVQLEAVPAADYTFKGWSGDLNSTSNPVTILVDCNKKITANFSRPGYTLTIQTRGSGSTSPAIGNHSYSDGTAVLLTATPENGWRFKGWTGDVAETGMATTTVIMASDKTVIAVFSRGTPAWWLTGTIMAAVVIGIIAWFTVRSRTA